MQKIKDVISGKSHEEREAERAAERSGYTGTGAGAGGYTTGTGATEYTGGVAGGPAYGSAATGYTGGESYETRTATAEVPVAVQQTTTTTTTGTEGVVAHEGAPAVCAQEHFTKVEDRPIVKERVEYIQEHRPVEKEFVVETRATGVERELAEGRTVEHLGTTERIVSAAQPKPPCE